MVVIFTQSYSISFDFQRISGTTNIKLTLRRDIFEFFKLVHTLTAVGNVLVKDAVEVSVGAGFAADLGFSLGFRGLTGGLGIFGKIVGFL